MEFIGFILAFVSFGYALYQQKRADKANALLAEHITKTGETVVNDVRSIFDRINKDQIENTNEDETSHGKNTQRFQVDYKDVDHDGKNEIIVQYPAGAHGNAVRIFGWRDMELEEIGFLGSGCPVPAEFKDIDNDGKLEILIVNTDWSVDLPYYNAPRLTDIYKWDGREFVEVGSFKNYTDEELEERRRHQE